MKHTLSALVLAASLTLAGCASFTPLTPGHAGTGSHCIEGTTCHPVSGRQYDHSGMACR